MTLTFDTTGSVGPNGLASAVTVNLTSVGGTATVGGGDYSLPASPMVTFSGNYASGTATQNAVVTINDDLLIEGDETAAFGLKNRSGHRPAGECPRRRRTYADDHGQ